MEFHDGAQLFKMKVQDTWPFDLLPYTDLTTKTSSPPDHAKVTTTRSKTMKRKKAEEEEVDA
jgi:hypothetical protein